VVARVGLYDDPVFREHDAGAGHPERPQRLEALRLGLRQAGLEDDLALVSPRPASREELLRAHTAAHVDLVASTEGRCCRFDPDTQAGPRSYVAALCAAGAVVDAVDRVLDGTLDRAFCAVRPPGHHATADRAMGFCLFNNVAVGAARALARGLRRVAIVDIDVHHGNGTQAIFWAEPRVLYVSSHQYPLYPGTGAMDEVGEGLGKGFTVNLPMPAGLGDGEYGHVYRTIVEPIGRAFDPELVLVSAGFDAHRNDPLAGMDLTDAGFAELADVCVGIAGGAAGGRLVAVFEGGYDPHAVAGAAAAVVGRLLDRPHAGPEPSAKPVAERLVESYRKTQASLWPVLAG
jgi:acetoin utilization deacetylase AcuC-like enzyme